MDEEVVLGHHILIVDDDRSLLTILSKLLGEDYGISTCSSGAEALQFLEENDVDLVLLDIMMPDLDGLEVCARMKANPRTAKLPVIFITGSQDDEAEEAALEAGGVDFISKPIRPRVVQTRVSLHVQNYLYLQFLENMLQERNITIDTLRAETRLLLASVGLASAR